MSDGNGVEYPEVSVQLAGLDGNSFAILGRVCQAMRSAGIGSAEVDAFLGDAMAGDYDQLLWVVMKTVDTRQNP